MKKRVTQYRKKPVMVYAIEWDGQNTDRVLQFCQNKAQMDPEHDLLKIATLEGVVRATYGDFIIQGADGEFYPCKPERFKKTYEEVR